MNESTRPIAATIALASASGARSMTGVAALSRALMSEGQGATGPQPLGLLAATRTPAISALFAAGEMLGDKMPGIPDRTDTLPLLGRVGAGAVIGAAIGAASGRNRLTGALLGAGVALVAAEVTFRLRRELSNHVPAAVAGMIEDAAVCWIAAAGSRLLVSREAAAGA